MSNFGSSTTATRQQLTRCFGELVDIRNWNSGPVEELPPNFEVCVLDAASDPGAHIYATCGASGLADTQLEFFILSPIQSESLVELLTTVAHYHHTGPGLGPDHTVNFGRPWLPGSLCEFGLLVDAVRYSPECRAKGATILWLIPITLSERQYKTANGAAALLGLLQMRPRFYLDVPRLSVL